MEIEKHLTTSSKTREEAFIRLYEILKILRSPEGCPWDRKQTPESFYKNLIEESYEYIDALKNNDLEECSEELGDIYLVITMLVIMHEEKEDFNLIHILDQTCEKLIRRHPHVFTDTIEADNPDSVVTLWDSIKQNVEGKKHTEDNPFSFIPKSLPPLERAEEIQKKAHKAGFDWPSYYGALEKIREETDELHVAINQKDTKAIEQEIGDLLFSVVNVSRFWDVPPHIALHSSNERFIQRYNTMPKLYSEQTGKSFEDASFDEMDIYWEKAKETLANKTS